MAKIPKEIWEQYKDLEFYPLPICCGCPCKGRIKVRKHHKFRGIPKYIPGHGGGAHKTKKPFDKEVDAILSGEVPWPLCGCPCKQKIEVKGHHRYNGIPKFIKGHNTRVYGSPMEKPEAQAKMRATLKEHRKIRFHSDISCEFMREIRTGAPTGPEYYRTFSDFISTGCHIYEKTRRSVLKHVNKTLSTFDLSKLDIELFLNWNIGHTLKELSEHFILDKRHIVERLNRIREIWPGVYQESIIYNTNKVKESIAYLLYNESGTSD